MLTQYIQALFFIFAAEMGDKTQILAMMFATKYKTSKVLIGIMIGSALNHGLAILFGSLLGKVIPIYVLQVVAGFAFIAFAIWTLLGEEEEEDAEGELEGKKAKSAIVVVAMAFFLGELGDKTQLTAITLSVDTAFPLIVLLGTVSGMLVTSSLGIFVGSKIGDRIPEALIKIISSGIFLVFGVIKLMSATPDRFINSFTVGGFVLVVSFTLILLLKSTIKAHQSNKLTPYVRAARNLYDYAHQIELAVDGLCKGVAHCGQCEGQACAVGFIRHLAKELQADAYDHDHESIMKAIEHHKDKFSRGKLIHTLKMTMRYQVTLTQSSEGYEEVDMIRRIVEMMLFEESIEYDGDIEAYEKAVEILDPKITKIQ